jgi:crotonobetainyl-CoA:carnitine CoA-transferase CaiB-like acyl-CoA transferase
MGAGRGGGDARQTDERDRWRSDSVETVLEAAGALRPGLQLRADVADPQVRHRGPCTRAIELGEVPHIRTPIKIGEGVRMRTVAPKLGQHNAEIFGRLAVSEPEMRRVRAKGVL